MILHKLYLAGFQLAILAYTTQSYVMLTANREDIKRIAEKFVSEAFADKIAEFVIRATEHMVTNLSEEKESKLPTQDKERSREETENNSKESGESTKYDISYEKQKEKRTTRDYSSREYDKNTNNDLRNRIMTETTQKYRQKEKNKIPDKRFSIENGPKQLEIYTEEKYKKYHLDRQISTSTRDTEAPTMSENDEYDSNNKTSSATTHSSVMEKPKKHFNKQKGDTSKSGEERAPYPKYKRTKQRDDVEISDSDIGSEASKYTNSVSDELSIESTNHSKGISVGLTTRKPRKTEFDQYDNTKYPKAVFVATSGNVRLPRMLSRKDHKKPYRNSVKSLDSMKT